MKLINILVILFSINIYSQADWERWVKAEASYKFKDTYKERDYSFSGNPGEFVLRAFVNGYWFFVSEVDGDNCPFEPSCSEFFIESVKETNIFRGILMFADRFTRDINFHNRHEHYPRAENGRYFDPPSIYTMQKENFSDPLFP